MAVKTKKGLAPEAFGFNGEFFTEARTMLDIVMKEGIKTITQKGIDEATVSLTMKIRLVENSSEDTPARATYIPLIEYKTGFNYKEKLEQSGLIGGADKILYTDDQENFIVRSDPNGQLEMDLD